MHSIVGAQMAKEQYAISQEMQDAIRYHTTGRTNMSLLEKIIYVADKTEENRDFPSVKHFRELAILDLDQAILEMMNATIQKCIRKDFRIHSLTIQARNELLERKEEKEK